MAFIACEQWARRTSEEKSRDWFKARIKKGAAGTTQQPQENTNTNQKRLDVNNLPPGYRVVKPAERKARIEAIRRMFPCQD